MCLQRLKCLTKKAYKDVAERVRLLAAGDGHSSSASLRTAAAAPRRPKIAPRFLSNSVGSSTNPAPAKYKKPQDGAFYILWRRGWKPIWCGQAIELSRIILPSNSRSPLKYPTQEIFFCCNTVTRIRAVGRSIVLSSTCDLPPGWLA
jgi:hypothetical protein